MIRDALASPIRGDDGEPSLSAVDALLVGSGLHLLVAVAAGFASTTLAPLAVPGALASVVVAGYLVRVLAQATTAEGRGIGGDSPPGFDDVRSLVDGGVAALVVCGAYLLVPVVVLAVTFRGVGSLSASAGGGGSAVMLLLGGTTTLLVAVAFAYPLPAALARYAVERRLGAAFERRALARAVRDARYFVHWWAGVALLAVGGVVAAATRPFVVGFFLAFYAEVVAARLWGRGSAVADGS